MRTLKYIVIAVGFLIAQKALNNIVIPNDRMHTSVWNCLAPFAECAAWAYVFIEVGKNLLRMDIREKYVKMFSSLGLGLIAAHLSLNLFDTANESVFRFMHPDLSEGEIMDRMAGSFELYNIFSLAILMTCYLICIFTYLTNKTPDNRPEKEQIRTASYTGDEVSKY